MKKVSLLISVFVLALGFSQCRKPVMAGLNTGNGEKQHITLSANLDNGGSKVAEDGEGKLKWEMDDEIFVYVTGTETELGSVKCVDPAAGTFEGTIDKTTGKIDFKFGTKPSYLEQAGIELPVYLEATGIEYAADGNYDVEMTMPYAVLKLDLSALGTASGTDVEIYANDVPVAKVLSVKTDSKTVYVAVEADCVKKLYVFDNGGNQIVPCPEWTLNPNTFYTTGNDAEAVKIEPAKFAIASNTYVYFSKGNMYYNGNSFEFEDKQYNCETSWSSEHVSHFFWSDKKEVAVRAEYSDSDITELTCFFTNARPGTVVVPNPGFTVGGETGVWRVLTKAETEYLIDSRGAKSFAKANVNGRKGLLLFPDGYNGTIVGDGIATVNDKNANFPATEMTTDAFKLLEQKGVVFLPCAGNRNNGSTIDYSEIACTYWTNDFKVFYYDGGQPVGLKAYQLVCSDSSVPGHSEFNNVVISDARGFTGNTVRLVRAAN